MRIEVPYVKTRFYNSVVDQHTFEKLKSQSKQELLQNFAEFKRETLSDYFKENKLERVLFNVFYPFVCLVPLLFVIMIILDFPEDSVLSELLTYGIIIGLISVIPFGISYSYGITLGELKRGLRIRKRNLLRAQKIAKKVNGYNEFVNLISTKS